MEQFNKEDYIKAHQELAETDGLVVDLTDSIRESIEEEIEYWEYRLARWVDLEGLDEEENQSRRGLAEIQLYTLQKRLSEIDGE